MMVFNLVDKEPDFFFFAVFKNLAWSRSDYYIFKGKLLVAIQMHHAEWNKASTSRQACLLSFCYVH